MSRSPWPYAALWGATIVAALIGALLHRACFAQGFSKAQEGAGQSGRGAAQRGPIVRRIGEAVLRPIGIQRRELVLKEIRVFFRDTTQWSQLLLLAVLIVLYVFNVKFLPLNGVGITFFLRNVIPFFNMLLAGFVLASIAARFVLPGVSLEGRTLWLLRSSPLEVRDLLWAKYWVGTLPLLVLAVSIVTVTNTMLQVGDFIFTVTVFTIALLDLCRVRAGAVFRHRVSAVRDGERRTDPDIIRWPGLHDHVVSCCWRREHPRSAASVHLPGAALHPRRERARAIGGRWPSDLRRRRSCAVPPHSSPMRDRTAAVGGGWSARIGISSRGQARAAAQPQYRAAAQRHRAAAGRTFASEIVRAARAIDRIRRRRRRTHRAHARRGPWPFVSAPGCPFVPAVRPGREARRGREPCRWT